MMNNSSTSDITSSTNIFSSATTTITTTTSKWYPDYTTKWAEGGCKNSTPYPFSNVQLFDSQFECCMDAFASQSSGACIEDIDKNSNMFTTSTTTPIALAATAPPPPTITNTVPTLTIIADPATPTGMCDFCLSGITTDKLNILAIDLVDRDYTCQSLQSLASTIPSSNNVCANVVKSVEFICCPPSATDPCNFCNDGDVDLKLDYIIPNTNGTTCGTAALFSASLEGNATECAAVKNAEMLCCPSGLDTTEDEVLLDFLMSMEMSMEMSMMSMMSIPPESTDDLDVISESCKFCEGKAVETETVIPSMVLTCGELVSYAASVKEYSMECDIVVVAELYCCNDDLNSITSTSVTPTYSPTNDTAASLTSKPTYMDERDNHSPRYFKCFIFYYCEDNSSRYVPLCLLGNKIDCSRNQP